MHLEMERIERMWAWMCGGVWVSVYTYTWVYVAFGVIGIHIFQLSSFVQSPIPSMIAVHQFQYFNISKDAFRKKHSTRTRSHSHTRFLSQNKLQQNSASCKMKNDDVEKKLNISCVYTIHPSNYLNGSCRGEIGAEKWKTADNNIVGCRGCDIRKKMKR